MEGLDNKNMFQTMTIQTHGNMCHIQASYSNTPPQKMFQRWWGAMYFKMNVDDSDIWRTKMQLNKREEQQVNSPHCMAIFFVEGGLNCNHFRL